MTEQDFTNRIDGLINDYDGGISTSKELRDGILDTLIELVSKVSPFEARVIKGDSPCAVANKWRYREFIVSEKTETDPTIYQFILDRNGVALLFTDEFTNIEGSSILIKREIIEDMVNKLNIAEQATASL